MKNTKIIFNLFGIILCMFQFFTCAGQENYVAGYIINNNAEKISGFIDYRNWEINPKSVKFKTCADCNPTSYFPTQISEFGVENDVYQSGIVKVETSPIRLNELTDDYKFSFGKDTAFLQLHFKGNVALLQYKNEFGREYYYVKKDNEITLLEYKKYKNYNSGSVLIEENKRFLGQLKIFLNDCSAIDNKLENTKYELRSLKELFTFYYKCSNSKTSYSSKEDKTIFSYGVFAGVTSSTLKFKGENFDYLTNANFNSSINPTLGLFGDFILKRNNGKWSLYNELYFTSYGTEGSYQKIVNENQYSNWNVEFAYKYIKLNTMLRYTHPIGKFKVFINGGMTNGWFISEKNYKKYESVFYSQKNNDEGLALDDTRKYEQGLVIGAGLKMNKFSSELRYERGNAMSAYTALQSITSRYSILFAYRIF